MANRMVLHIAGQKYNLVSDESADYMHEVAAEAKCRALEAELAALRDRQTQNNGKHPNHNRK